MGASQARARCVLQDTSSTWTASSAGALRSGVLAAWAPLPCSTAQPRRVAQAEDAVSLPAVQQGVGVLQDREDPADRLSGRMSWRQGCILLVHSPVGQCVYSAVHSCRNCAVTRQSYHPNGGHAGGIWPQAAVQPCPAAQQGHCNDANPAEVAWCPCWAAVSPHGHQCASSRPLSAQCRHHMVPCMASAGPLACVLLQEPSMSMALLAVFQSTIWSMHGARWPPPLMAADCSARPRRSGSTFLAAWPVRIGPGRLAPKDEAQGRAREVHVGAQLLRQVPFVLLVDQLGVIDEQHKGGRLHSCLWAHHTCVRHGSRSQGTEQSLLAPQPRVQAGTASGSAPASRSTHALAWTSPAAPAVASAPLHPCVPATVWSHAIPSAWRRAARLLELHVGCLAPGRHRGQGHQPDNDVQGGCADALGVLLAGQLHSLEQPAQSLPCAWEALQQSPGRAARVGCAHCGHGAVLGAVPHPFWRW